MRAMTRRCGGVSLVAAMLGALLTGCSAAGPSVTIVSPAEGAVVPAGEPVAVELRIQGAHLEGADGSGPAGHLHIYVNRKQVLVARDEDIAVTLEPGAAEITVEFAGDSHDEVSVVDRVDVTAR